MRRSRSVVDEALATLVLGLLVTIPMGCTGPSEEVRAQRIALVDDDGAERATIALEEGAPKLRLYDGEGRRRASVALSSEGEPGVALLDENEKVRAAVEMDHGKPRVVFYHADGRVHREIQ